jgi:hypothetical protein
VFINYLLGILGVNFDSIQAIALFHFFDYSFIGTSDFVHLNNGIQSPISDKETALIDHQTKGVTNHPGRNCFNISAI